MRGFSSFPVLGFPGARVVYARRGDFPAFKKTVIGTASPSPFASLPSMRGVWEVIVLGLANPKTGSACTIKLLALSAGLGGTVVGEADLVTDQSDSIPTLFSIGANSAVAFHLLFRPSVDQRLNCQGVSFGGFCADLAGTTAVPGAGAGLPTTISTSTQNVIDGPIDLALQATATSGAFTLDAVYALEYPEPTDVPY